MPHGLYISLFDVEHLFRPRTDLPLTLICAYDAAIIPAAKDLDITFFYKRINKEWRQFVAAHNFAISVSKDKNITFTIWIVNILWSLGLSFVFSMNLWRITFVLISSFITLSKYSCKHSLLILSWSYTSDSWGSSAVAANVIRVLASKSRESSFEDFIFEVFSHYHDLW